MITRHAKIFWSILHPKEKNATASERTYIKITQQNETFSKLVHLVIAGSRMDQMKNNGSDEK